MSTPKGDGSFNIYDDIRDKLVAMGIPKEEIAFIHETNSDKQKDEMFVSMERIKSMPYWLKKNPKTQLLF